ncbi:MAG: transcriptional repressor [Rikenellaceae bacterium]|nr:transcriptional repressor [Rikenellaceae bacterium]
MDQVKVIQQKLSERGLKATPQRIAVYQALLDLGHVCAEEVVAQVHRNFPTISLATIYNTLDALLEQGIITQVHTGSNKKYYDVHVHQHVHLYDRTDHRIEDFEDPALENLIREYISRQPVEGFELSDIQIQLIGKFRNEPPR